MNALSYISVTILIVSILMLGCASSQTSTDLNQQGMESEDNEQMTDTDIADNELLLISNLSDTYTSNNNLIPEEYAKIKKEQEAEVDLTKGYRIQIYSGQNVFDADTIASQFRAWSDTTISGYQAETYTFFKTPYYRVHVGDFHNKELALTFSKLVKRFIRDAWVVYDTVDPFLVPSDTTKIMLQEF